MAFITGCIQTNQTPNGLTYSITIEDGVQAYYFSAPGVVASINRVLARDNNLQSVVYNTTNYLRLGTQGAKILLQEQTGDTQDRAFKRMAAINQLTGNYPSFCMDF